MIKKLTALCMATILALTICAGCSKKKDSDETKAPETQVTGEASKTNMKIAVLKGATAIGMVKLMDDAAVNNTANNYTFSVHTTADEINTALIKGELDMACIPCNVASVLYNKTQGKVILGAVNTLGVLYIVETGNTINNVQDLKGKTIYSTAQGSTPEYTLRYLLTKAGIDPDKDVKIEFKSESSEVAAILSKSEGGAIAMLPQPYVASAMTANRDIRIALDVTKEWEKVADNSTVVTGVLVMRKEYADKNPEAVKAFMKEYSDSISFASSDIDGCAALLEKYDIFKAAIAKKAMPYITTKFLSNETMKTFVSSYLSALYEQNPTSIGGKLPADDFYYIQK